MDAIKYWLLNENKFPLYIDANGMVSVAGIDNLNDLGFPATLKYAPTGWKDTLVKYARNNKALGMSRDFTVPMDFVRDGKKILQDSMWRYGMDVQRYMILNTVDKIAFPERYNHFYTGELDFSKIFQKNDRIALQVTEGGLSKDLKANENTEYQIQINNDGARKKLYFDGLLFTNTVDYTIYDGQDIATGAANLGMGIISQEGYTQGVVFQDQSAMPPASNPNEDWFEKSFTKNITSIVSGTINIKVNIASAVVITIRKIQNVPGGFNSTDYFLPVTAGLLQPGNYSFPYSRIIPMGPGDQLYLVDEGNPSGGGSVAYHTILKSDLSVKYDVKFDATNVEGLSPKHYLQLLIDRISPGAIVQSSFLDSLEYSIMLTSGQALRRYGAESYLKGSYSDFYQSFKSFGVGYAVEGNTLRFEKHAYFFRKGIALSLGQVKDWELSVAEDLVCNTFKFGWPEVDTGKVNGRDEFNVTVNYTSPLKRVVQELDLVSKYHAGMYEIEVARIDFFGQDTTDSSVDNTVYMLNINKGVSYNYYTGPFTIVSPTEIDIPAGAYPQPTGGIDTFTVFDGTNITGPFTFTGGVFGNDPTQLGFTGGGLAPGTYNGTLTLNSPQTYKLNRPTFTSVTGLLHPAEAFNILLRPAISALNNGPYIHSIVDTYNDTGSLVFTSGDRNSDLVTNDNGVILAEKNNIPIGGMGPQLFKPYYIKFKTKVPFNYNQVMTNNPYDLVEFELQSVPGYIFTAYIWDGGCAPGDDESQQWQLLMGPDNDMSKLINA